MVWPAKWYLNVTEREAHYSFFGFGLTSSMNDRSQLGVSVGSDRLHHIVSGVWGAELMLNHLTNTSAKASIGHWTLWIGHLFQENPITSFLVNQNKNLELNEDVLRLDRIDGQLSM